MIQFISGNTLEVAERQPFVGEEICRICLSALQAVLTSKMIWSLLGKPYPITDFFLQLVVLLAITSVYTRVDKENTVAVMRGLQGMRTQMDNESTIMNTFPKKSAASLSWSVSLTQGELVVRLP